MEESVALQTTRKQTSILPKRNKIALSLSRSGRVWKKMRNLVRLLEKCNGNVSMACEQAGVQRKTYYRWITGTENKLHLRFQQLVGQINADERRMDLAEGVVDHHLGEKNLFAAMFTLKSKGRKRGWNERELPAGAIVVTKEAFEQVVEAFRAWLDDFRDAPESEKVKWLCRFADNSGVDCRKLAERVGVQLPEDHKGK